MAETRQHQPMKTETNSLAITGQQIAGSRHACAFFDGPEEEYRVLLPFAKDCAQCGDRCFHLLAAERKAERTQWLAEAGVDVAAVQGGAELLSWDETYLRGGRFVIDEMLELIRELVDRGNGAPRARLWANVPNALADEALVEYESRLNPVIERSDAIVVCTYPVGRYSAEFALGVLRAHPWILVNGKLEPNPVYVPLAESQGT